MVDNVFNVPLSCSFVDVLAQKFGSMYANNPAGLSKVVFLVPNRRTVISLKNAFIRFNGLNPAILPRILPVGDINEEDVFIQDSDKYNFVKSLPPAIDEYERLFLFARLISSRPREYGLAQMTWGQAFALAKDLASMQDKAYNEGLLLNELEKIVPDQYAKHWQETLKFLQIIMSYWPQILKERGVVDSVQRKNMLLSMQADYLIDKQPSSKIVAAGITGGFTGLKKILAAVKTLPHGEIYFYGVDCFLSKETWELIDENHPQFEHKQLLEFLQLERTDLIDCGTSSNIDREKFASEIMRPAADTWRWRNLQHSQISQNAVNNLHLINCTDSRQEALSIALILRQTLETKGKTAALVTPDRELARRTASELERWGIKIDDSAGKPLHLTPVGIFLRLVIFVVEQNMSDLALATLFKNPFMRLGNDVAKLRHIARAWEKQIRTPHYFDEQTNITEEAKQLINDCLEVLRPLINILQQPKVDFSIMLETHIRVAEALSGAENLWRGDDGKMASSMLSRILPQAQIVGQIEPSQYLSFLTALLASETVRSNFNTHPRIRILGPIEARFNHFDTVIIGSANEGMWPALPSGDPWLSRPMKKEFGMSLPEQNIGIMAADFAHLLCSPEVYITCAARSGGTPTNKSRWQLRLETVLSASKVKLRDLYVSPYVSLSEKLEQSDLFIKINPPQPCPPIYARPRRLSASAIEVLMRDPYEIFAGRILKLKQLTELDSDLAPSDYGNCVHKILECFCKKYPRQLPTDSKNILLQIGTEIFAQNDIPAEKMAFWWPSFMQTVDWFLATEAEYRPMIDRVCGEVAGSFEFEAPAGKFTLEARADRVDVTKDGKINIIDYKTGEIRTNKEIDAGYAPQLPLEGLIASHGGFVSKDKNIDIPAAEVNGLFYWQLGKKSQEYSKDTELLIEKTFERLQKLVSVFDFETTGYASRPNPKHILKYAKYEHLARVKEWSTGEDNG